ncbi:NFIL3 like protein [Ochotona princeps]|uniref:NFIL3 like protein n=1 Tax=Ochotona princeps TaxID=9978 RepID=UPI002714CF8F|nr:NFIL3 like protein [Ochotona princeps]
MRRRQREFTPEDQKDTVYWEKRRKNNEAAKRSREKRRLHDAALEGRLAALLRENALLRAELRALQLRSGLVPALGSPGNLPLYAVLWEPPWTGGDRYSGGGGSGGGGSAVEPISLLPGSRACLLRPCSLGAGLPGCQACLASPPWTGLAAPPQEPTSPAAVFSCHLWDRHLGSRLELGPCWELWSPVHLGHRAPGPPDVLTTAGVGGLTPEITCPILGDKPEGLALPSVPHKLPVKSQVS